MEDEELFTIHQGDPEPTITFSYGTEKVGKLSFDGKKFIFEGDADESSKRLLEFMNKNYNTEVKELKAKVDKLKLAMKDSVSDYVKLEAKIEKIGECLESTLLILKNTTEYENHSIDDIRIEILTKILTQPKKVK